jgi:hypothetical protein
VQLRSAREWIEKLIPPTDPMILVDEEHIRHQFKNRAIFPFVERDGHYWGPPPDDRTAIQELERLRSVGATHVAFIWSTFWWLDHYAQFAQHLRKEYSCVAENSDVVIFRLASSSQHAPP